MRYLLVVLALVQLAGCATVVNGTTQKIGVSSTPTGAEVSIDNQQRVITPAAIELARSQSHTFLFHKDGYQDDSFVITSGTSGWVWGNVLIGGLIGGMVDFATGAARTLSQDSVHVTLQPVAVQGVAPVVYSAPSPPASVPAVSVPAVATPTNLGNQGAPPADVQLRNAEREFRAGRMGLEEFRQIKKVLEPAP